LKKREGGLAEKKREAGFFLPEGVPSTLLRNPRGRKKPIFLSSRKKERGDYFRPRRRNTSGRKKEEGRKERPTSKKEKAAQEKKEKKGTSPRHARKPALLGEESRSLDESPCEKRRGKKTAS